MELGKFNWPAIIGYILFFGTSVFILIYFREIMKSPELLVAVFATASVGYLLIRIFSIYTKRKLFGN